MNRLMLLLCHRFPRVCAISTAVGETSLLHMSSYRYAEELGISSTLP